MRATLRWFPCLLGWHFLIIIALAIIAHNDDIERQLAAQEEREAEQRKKLEDLHIETPELPQRLATPQLQPRNHSPLAVGLLESNKWGNR